MATPYMSEIRIMAFNFPPRGWAQCNGQLLQINQNQALFALLGTMYGGDGRTTFGLPNLQARVPIHRGSGFIQGQLGGEQVHTLTSLEEPMHTHVAQGSAAPADTSIADQNFLGAQSNFYAGAANTTPLVSSTIANAGGSQPHDNMQPYLVLNFCIALQGAFPTPN